MQTASLDLLEKTQLPPNQARAILQAMELEITAHEVGFCTRAELKDAVHSLELKIEALHADLNLKFEMLRSEINGTEVRMMRFIVSCLLGMAGIMVGVLYFSLTHLRP